MVTKTGTEMGLSCFISFAKSYIDGVIISFQVSLNLIRIFYQQC